LLEVSNNLWNWHNHGVGGNLIDYHTKINGYSFVDAVRELAGDDIPYSRPIPPKARPPALSEPQFKPFSDREPLQLPPRNRDNKRVIHLSDSERRLSRGKMMAEEIYFQKVELPIALFGAT
jgi:hypothetical protein